MRKIFSIFAILFIWAYSALAVNFEVTVEDSVKNGQPGDGIEEGGFIKNTTDHDIVMSVNRITNDIPSGWTTTLCVGSTCYSSDVSSVNEVVPAGDSILYSITFHTDSEPGTGQSVLQFYELGGDPGTEEHLYTASTEASALYGTTKSDVKSFELMANFPNPFNPSTIIRYHLPAKSLVELSVFNLQGKKIATLLNQRQNAGTHQIAFDGESLSSGTYLYRLQAGKEIAFGKMLLLK